MTTARAILSITDVLSAELDAQRAIEDAVRRRTEISAQAKRSAHAELKVFKDGLAGELAIKRSVQDQAGVGEEEDRKGSQQKIADLEKSRDHNQDLVVDTLLSKVLTVKVPVTDAETQRQTLKTLFQYK
eukprot:Hpha_TRINITY_DN12761_c0_g2::TRINITY_DN12761_c0_g2_i1::g.114606::m.114606